MNHMKILIILLNICVSLMHMNLLAANNLPTTRCIPAPLPSHPGNVFLVGEEVSVLMPTNLTGKAEAWRLVTETDRVIATGSCLTEAGVTNRLGLGKLGIGWYRVNLMNQAGASVGWTTAAVLAPLGAPTPQNSPVCLDVASAWFARNYGANKKEHMEYYANLAALAGANWVRDRITWAELEKAPGVPAPENDYDLSATIQADAALKILSTFHSTPAWAADKVLDGKMFGLRFPRDLRDHYRFCKAMALRFHGKILAWEPWNEANLDVFGGHTTTEMSSLQKAAFLGYKASDPDMTVCWNVFAGAGTPDQTRNILANEAWPYYDTYNIHSYEPPAKYLELFATAREAACGKPVWLSECGIYQPWQTPPPWGELTPENELRHARFLAQSYACSMYAGVSRLFSFILGNYVEKTAQLGLMRHDHTPRPGYVAFAAIGRLLADARCLGRLPVRPGDNVRVYAFSAMPGGVRKDILVAWSESGESPWSGQKPGRIDGVVDYLGRDMGSAVPVTLKPEAVFVILPAGGASKLKLEPPMTSKARQDLPPSPVVLQLNEPYASINLAADAYTRNAGETSTVEVIVYNFASHPVAGTITPESLPVGWAVSPSSWQVKIEPLGRLILTGKLIIPAQGLTHQGCKTLNFRGEFGSDGRPVLAFNVVVNLASLHPVLSLPLLSATKPDQWVDSIGEGSTLTHQAVAPNGMQFSMAFGAGDAWCYPVLSLATREIPDDKADGLACTIQVQEGEGTMRVQFDLENGATYIADLPVDATIRAPQAAACLFANATWGPWSKPDALGHLKPSHIRKVRVGINSTANTKVKYTVSNLAWVQY